MRAGDGKTDLRRDKLEAGVLPPCLLVDDVLNDGIDLGEGGIQGFVLNRKKSDNMVKRI